MRRRLDAMDHGMEIASWRGPRARRHPPLTRGRPMELESLRELYIDELKDLYSAEKQLVKALPKMVKNATNPDLKTAFSDHLAQTEGHVARLEQIFESLESSPRGKK